VREDTNGERGREGIRIIGIENNKQQVSSQGVVSFIPPLALAKRKERAFILVISLYFAFFFFLIFGSGLISGNRLRTVLRESFPKIP